MNDNTNHIWLIKSLKDFLVESERVASILKEAKDTTELLSIKLREVIHELA